MRRVLYCQLGEQAPEIIRLLPLGEVVLADGRQPFQVTQESLAQILASWRRRGHDLVIDYEHQSMSGKEAPAAGWIKDLWEAADGLYAQVAWTERARAYIDQKEYRYFSPVVELGEGREVTDLLQVALTNCPAISNLEPLVLHRQLSPPDGREVGQAWVEDQGQGEENGGEHQETKAEGGKMIERLRTIFGLAQEAGEAEIVAMAIDLVRRQQESSGEVAAEVLKVLGLDSNSAGPEVIEKAAALQALAAEAEALRQELLALQEERRTEKAEQMIQEALRGRKTTPAELEAGDGRLRRLAKDDPEFFQTLILSRRENWAVPGPLFGAQKAKEGLSPEELRLCEIMSLKPEVFLQNRQQLEQGE